MKKCDFLILSVLVCLLCQSCHNEEIEDIEVTENIPANRVGMLYNGGNIFKIRLECLAEYHTTMPSEEWLEYYCSTNTVPDYSSFCLRLSLGQRNTTICNTTMRLAKLKYEYLKEKTLFIYESYKNYTPQPLLGVDWPNLLTAYLNGELSITCDKILFGEQPGTNLISYFTASGSSGCIPIGIENPKILYDFGEEIPTEAPKLFIKETWLQQFYHLRFAKQPNEKYEDLTFHVSLPMIRENVDNIVVSKDKGTEPVNQFSEAVFTADCTIKFNWD